MTSIFTKNILLALCNRVLLYHKHGLLNENSLLDQCRIHHLTKYCLLTTHYFLWQNIRRKYLETISKIQSPRCNKEEKKSAVMNKKLIDMHEDNEKLQDSITMLSAKNEALYLKKYHTEEKL